MRESIGGTWITQLVMVMMFVFVAFLALSVNYSKAFRVKNQMISIIEKNEGIDNETIKMINNYLKNNNQVQKGSCPSGYYGVNLDNTTYELAIGSKKYNYCFAKTSSSTLNFSKRSYYDVKLFLKFNLPVVGDIFVFKIDGQTKDISYPVDGSCEDAVPKLKCLSRIK